MTGCDSCHRSRPYTPYTLDEPDAAAVQTAPEDADAGAQAAFVPIQAIPPPGDGKTWPIDAAHVVPAPAGRAFGLGLLMDVEGDGTPDLLGWAAAPDGVRGELVFASGASPDSSITVAPMPVDLTPRGCKPDPVLAQIGPHTAAFDFGIRCTTAGPRLTRWIAIIRLSNSRDPRVRAAPGLILELRVALPHPNEVVTVAVDGRDRDQDGHDDVTIRVTLAGAVEPFSEGPEVTTSLVYLDRPAGLSREPDAPSTSLSSIAQNLVSLAQSKSKAPGVAPHARQLRRLFTLLCAESGAPQITTATGPVRCGNTAFLEDASYAEALAAFTLNDPARAITALSGANQPLKNPLRQKEIERYLAKNAPVANITASHKIGAGPVGGEPPGLGRGPLAFDANGDLLVRTSSGVVRVDATNYAESPADVPRWPEAFGLSLAPSARADANAGSGASLASGLRLVSVEQRCEAPVLWASLQGGSAADGEPRRAKAMLPILTRFPCARIASVPWVPLDASDKAITFAVGTEILTVTGGMRITASAKALPLGGTGLRGAARSPDGATVALPFEQGVLVVSGTAARRWLDPNLVGAWGYAPSNDGKRLALVSGREAMVLEAP